MSDKKNYDVKAHFGVIGTKKRKGVTTELQLRKVSWFGSAPMWDIREWDPDDNPGKGITLNDEMMRTLIDILSSIEL